jgi:hypothetical protein
MYVATRLRMPEEANRATSNCCSLLRWLSGIGETRWAACDETWKMSPAAKTNDACLILIRCSFHAASRGSLREPAAAGRGVNSTLPALADRRRLHAIAWFTTC